MTILILSLILIISSADALYSNTTRQTTSDQLLLYGSHGQGGGTADYILQGIGAQQQHTSGPKTSNALPDLTGRPLPSTGISPNASWQTNTIASSTQRPDKPIRWSSSMPKVEKCWSDIVTWRSSSVSWWNENYGGRTVSGPLSVSKSVATYNTTITTTIYPSSASVYTLCDGSPRVDVKPETKTLVQDVPQTNSHTMIANISLPDWSVPQSCEPDPHMCRMWYYQSDVSDVNEGELLSQCGRPTNYNESCVIRGGPIELIYWPVPPKADICENNVTGILGPTAFVSNPTAQPEFPETITTLGHTFTSGTVYLSFSTLYASWDGFWDHVGPDFSDLIVPLPSSSLFTQCGGQRFAHNHGTPLNYADLNWPVPASAYSCQARCDPVGLPICPQCSHTEIPSTGECGTIWSDINPNLAMPTQIRDLVPEWSTCLMYNDRIPNFWFDPPLALTKQTAIVVPTQHAQPTTEPAAPSSSIPSAVPAETGSANIPESSVTQASTAASQADSDVPAQKEPVATNMPLSTTHSNDAGEPMTQDATTTLVHEPPSPSGTALSEGGVDSPSQTTSSQAPIPIASNSKSLFTYDPMTSTIDSVTIEHPVSSTPAANPSLDALSVLESALSSINGATSPTATTEASYIGVTLDSETVYFPLPTLSSDTGPQIHSSDPQDEPDDIETSQYIYLTASDPNVVLSIDSDKAAVIEPSRTTSVLLSETAIISSLFSSNGPSTDFMPTSAKIPTEQQPSTHRTSNIASETSQPAPSQQQQPNNSTEDSSSSSSFTYSPLDADPDPATSPPPSSSFNAPSPQQSETLILAAGTLTLTAQQANSHQSLATSIVGTTLSVGGEAVTLWEKGDVISLASDGIVIVSATSGGEHQASVMSTVIVSSEPATSQTQTSSDLPSVILDEPEPEPEPTRSGESSSSGNGEGDRNAADGAEESATDPPSSGASRSAQGTGAIAICAVFVSMMLLV